MSRRLRVLHLSSLYPPHIVGGAERSVSMLAEAQAAAGWDVAAACLTPGDAVEEERGGVRVFRMPHGNDFWLEDWLSHTQRQREWAKFKQQANFAIERRFGAVIDAFKPDIVNTHSMVDISTRVWRAAQRRGVPIVHTLRDFDLLCAASSMFRDTGPCTHRHLKCRVLTFTKQFDQRAVSAVTAVGGEVLERHLRYRFFDHVPPHHRRVIWNTAQVAGIADDYVKPALSGPITFGYLGRLSPEKGVDTLLAAARLLPPTGWRLLIAGAALGPIEPYLELAAGLPVEFIGFQSPKDLFERIDVLVTPSLWAEPLGRTVLEAYQAQVPVIGSRSGGIAEIIADDAWLVAPGDVAALVERMRAVLDHGRPGPPAGRARVVARTTPGAVADAFAEVYTRLLS
ncbi:glycosyltransferase family 4 protein [Microvirga sp. SRT01]|uniref:Glycosyltransferase family 4 protein n=1 Tax=Sphingomonas longa TaxID=2778730 RepID=A0ABS2D971_9SPHN|nr:MULTISPECIES: glycosyltransferase family 4 protein [Alphaproteobacteria]MBM6577479.1 glycosyltransferase family 4 protein [Sphingomonas sp. BT552]MBR7710524.1 glycosyltransferase family 4 protein [Microvirga sp. SRT01]